MEDELSSVIKRIAELRLPVFNRLPHRFEDANLPAVWVQHVGPPARAPALNTVGVDYVDLDVDVFVSRSAWETGEATRLAHVIRRHLDYYRDGGIRVLGTTRPVPRPDFNNRIRRLGLTVRVGIIN